MWFAKTHPGCIYGPRHLDIKLSRYLVPCLKMKITTKLLLFFKAMVFLDTQKIFFWLYYSWWENQYENIGVEKNIESDKTTPSVRTFVVPKLNYDVINLSVVTVNEPALFKIITNDVLFDCIMYPELSDEIILPRIKIFPCHTQAIERCVKVVTEASAAVYGLRNP